MPSSSTDSSLPKLPKDGVVLDPAKFSGASLAPVVKSEPKISSVRSEGSGRAEKSEQSEQLRRKEESEEITEPIAEEDRAEDPEMSLFDHLGELRSRLLISLVAVVAGIIGCFVFVNSIVYLLEQPAQGVKFLQLAPGEYFFVSFKVAGYSGILVASPMILYQIVSFILPGLTKREKRLVTPIVFGSSILFGLGLTFAYLALIPAALNFFINYGGNVVEQLWSIDRYFEFVLLLLFSTGLAFQIPVVQALLALVGIINSKQMLSSWRYVILGAVVLGAVLTPSTDPLTQSLLAGAVGGLYFGGIGLVKLLGK
jgi:sec-independent protein translocase protein TatC